MSLLRHRGTERRAANLGGLVRIFESVGRSGRSTGGQSVNTDTSRQLTAVWRCQHLLADIVAGLPLDQYRNEGDVRREVAPSEFVRSPSQFVDSHDWRYQMMLSAPSAGASGSNRKSLFATKW